MIADSGRFLAIAVELNMPTERAWDVFIVEYGCSTQPWTSLVCDTYFDGMVDLPLSFILARQGERNILIDTRFIQEGDKNEFEPKFRVSRWISPLRMLGEVGDRAGSDRGHHSYAYAF